MPDLVKGTIQSAVDSVLSGYGATQEMTPTEFAYVVEAVIVAIDAMNETVDPNSPIHPSSPR